MRLLNGLTDTLIDALRQSPHASMISPGAPYTITHQEVQRRTQCEATCSCLQ